MTFPCPVQRKDKQNPPIVRDMPLSGNFSDKHNVLYDICLHTGIEA